MSYPRVLAITKSLSDSVIDQYFSNKGFSPRNINKHVFIMIAKDNIARSTTSTTHYHGISTTRMQFPTEENPGEDQPAYSPQLVTKSISKKVRALPSSYTEVKPLFLPKQKHLFANLSLYDDNEQYNRVRSDQLYCCCWIQYIIISNQMWPYIRGNEGRVLSLG